jgi:protocatechuate 3,4-dioxygenase beta subunit
MLVGTAVLQPVLIIAALQSPQTPPQAAGSGLILGRVVDAASGRPIPSAIVTLGGFASAPIPSGIPAPQSQPRAMTNANGQFVFRSLPKGSFSLNATRSGYVDGAYGRRRPGGSSSTVQLDDGQRVGDVVIRMWRQAVISGTVTDEAGEPLVGVPVRAFRRVSVAGKRRYQPAGSASSTDDRGMYRFNALTPGDFVVAFVSREVTMPAALEDVPNASMNPNDKSAQALTRGRSAIGAFGGSPSTGDGVRIGDTIRQVPMSGPVPPMLTEANAPTYVYPTQFFPNAPSSARASVITIESGQQRDSVDLSLHPTRAFAVSGTILGPDGPGAMIPMRLVPAGDDSMTEIEAAATLADGNGNFTFLGAPPGQYVIKAASIPQPSRNPLDNTTTTRIQVGGSMMISSTFNPAPTAIPDDPSLYASVDVGVSNSDVKGVVVALQRGGRVSGHLEFDGTLDRPDGATLGRTFVTLDRVDALPFSGSVFGGMGAFVPAGHPDETGAFKTYGQAPGRYLVRVAPPPAGWTLKSVKLEGRDISEAPFDIATTDINNVVITFTDRPTKISGTVTKDGSPDPDALVVAFPIDPAAWSDSSANPRRMRSTRVPKNGAYSIAGLPAGEYYVAAIAEDNVSQWQDPQFLADLARSATTVRLSDGDTRTQNLVRSGGDR